MEEKNFLEKIMEVYRETYHMGENENFEDGETQVFALNDCTVIISMNDGNLGVNVTQDKPIPCDFSSGLFVESED